MELEAIKAWLLGSIPGVIIVGGVGSIVGSLILHCLKLWWKAGANKRFELAQRVLFPLRVLIYNSEKLRDEAGARTADGKYVVYVMVHCVFVMAGLIALFMSLGFCIYTYLTYGLDRAQVLSFFVGSTLFFFYVVFKDFVMLWAFVSEDIAELDDRIEEGAPKNLAEWHEMRSREKEIETPKEG
ncbi:hypothetical protein [Ectopseudomonas toyotomiensis]|uniref:hypothetical protein n=1 Tax=Ectopseudomonas toyotomiensis TaxID=554344 RepID=UPI003D0B50A3